MADRVVSANARIAREHQQPEPRLVSSAIISEAGISAGIVSGLVMLAFEMVAASLQGYRVFEPLYLIGATFYGPDALVGGTAAAIWGGLLHVAVSAWLGFVFAWIVGPYPHGVAAFGWGVVYALSLMFVMTTAVLPWADPTLYLRIPQISAAWVVGHLLFGVCLSLTPAYIRRS